MMKYMVLQRTLKVWGVTIVVALVSISTVAAQSLLIPMDAASQTDHLKAYGIVYWILTNNQPVDWLLNYRGGSFLCPSTSAIAAECRVRGVSFEAVDGAAVAQMNKAMEGLEKKWTQAIKRKEEDQINAIKKGKQQLFPNGILQERRESFLPFYAKHGPSLIADLISEFITTDSSQFLVLNPEADA